MAHSQEEMQENSALPNFYNSNIGHKFIYLFTLLFIYMNKAWNKYNCLANSSKYYYVIYAVIKIWKF